MRKSIFLLVTFLALGCATQATRSSGPIGDRLSLDESSSKSSRENDGLDIRCDSLRPRIQALGYGSTLTFVGDERSEDVEKLRAESQRIQSELRRIEADPVFDELEKLRDELRAAERAAEADQSLASERRYEDLRSRFRRAQSDPRTRERERLSERLNTIESKLFETSPRSLRVPVEFVSYSRHCHLVSVAVMGTVPAELDRDYSFEEDYISRSHELVFTPAYLDLVHTGDQMSVRVEIRRRDARGEPDEVAAYATRKFTLYSVADYRDDVLDTRFRTHEVSAFPLPEAQAEDLFGPLVAENFFVVRLSLRNGNVNKDRLVSTGMIVASGRALVEAMCKRQADCDNARSYAVPVDVVPQSAEQMYTLLDDRQPQQMRAWTFRGLKFVGALGAAASSAFAGPTLIQASSLYTGTFIPSLEELLPDPYSAYKRNIVSYSMPDLVKVPKNSVTGHKFLFFSKNKIEAIVQDHLVYGGFGKQDLNPFSDEKPTPPRIAVISLAFDNLDVPFENVSAAADSSTEGEE